MANYLTSPNFQSFNFRPYELPVAQIAQAISSRSQAWEISASQLKDAYEQAAGLSLSRRESKEKLQQFMTKADDLMRKTSRTELSVGDNQKRAMNIFKPLYQDDTIMLDHANTEFYKEQFQQAENSKLRDGGKEYSPTNVAYMQKKYNAFLTDPNYDAQTLQKHYNERRAYTPYYNYGTEMENITKLCKPNSYSSQGIKSNTDGTQSLYFDVQSDKSLSQSKLAGCLSSGLTDRAKNQMAIEGYMAYDGNYQGLANDYIAHSDKELNSFRTQKGAADGRIQGLRAKGNLTEAEQVELAQLEDTSKQFGEYITDQLKTRDVVAGGNLDYIRDNFEKLAAPLYMNQKIGQYSQFFQYTEQSQKLEENNAAMLQYKAQQDVNNMAEKFKQQRVLNAQDFVYDYQIEQLRQSGALEREQMQQAGKLAQGFQRVRNADGTWTTVPTYPDLDPAANEANLKANSQAIVNERLATAVGAKDRADQFLLKNLGHIAPQYKDSKSFIASPEFQNYMKAHPDDGDISAWSTANQQSRREITRIEALKIGVENQLRETNPELFNNSKVSSKQALKMPDGQVFDANRIANAIKGLDPELSFQSVPGNPGDLNNPFSSVLSEDVVMMYKGRPVRLEGTQARQVYTQIRNQIGDQVNTINEKRSALYANKYLQLDGRKDIGADNTDKNNTVKNRVAATLGVPAEQVILNYSNLTGDVWLQLKDNDKSPLPENTLEKLRGAYKVDKEGDMFKLSGIPEYNLYQANSYYKDFLIDINAHMEVNKSKLNQDQILEIPIPSQRDSREGKTESTYKIGIKRGPSNDYMYKIYRKNANGEYVPSTRRITSPLEAMKLIEEMDKYDK